MYHMRDATGVPVKGTPSAALYNTNAKPNGFAIPIVALIVKIQQSLNFFILKQQKPIPTCCEWRNHKLKLASTEELDGSTLISIFLDIG